MKKTVEWKENQLQLIDQRELPHHFNLLYCKNHHEVADAIRQMAVRGAPAIGAAAAYGMALAARNIASDSRSQFIRELKKAEEELSHTRPTAVNLFWALKEIWHIIENSKEPIEQLREKILIKANQIAQEDIEINHRIGNNGADLFDDGDGILTHCNAGSLATVCYGTALGVIRSVFKQKKKIKVFADETRPVLQGARLTAWELQSENIPVSLICDSAAGFLMYRKKINKVIVGADRIAANGDVANKIGTYSISVLAKYHHIPFYIAAPVTTIDLSAKSGKNIPIEERSAFEVTTIMGQRVAPEDIEVFNPAFDITPFKNITAIITEKGIARPPYEASLRRITNCKI